MVIFSDKIIHEILALVKRYSYEYRFSFNHQTEAHIPLDAQNLA